MPKIVHLRTETNCNLFFKSTKPLALFRVTKFVIKEKLFIQFYFASTI